MWRMRLLSDRKRRADGPGLRVLGAPADAVYFEAFAKPYALSVAALVRETPSGRARALFCERRFVVLGVAEGHGLRQRTTIVCRWTGPSTSVRLGNNSVRVCRSRGILILHCSWVLSRKWKEAVQAAMEGAGGPGMHVLNLGHGVQPAPEEPQRSVQGSSSRRRPAGRA